MAHCVSLSLFLFVAALTLDKDQQSASKLQRLSSDAEDAEDAAAAAAVVLSLLGRMFPR